MQKSNNLPVVAIVGRPNVGKSSLFNCLIRERRAVVFDEPGTTRDSVSAVVPGDFPYLVVDTAGLSFTERGEIETNMRGQTQVAISGADLIIFMVDAREGLTTSDREVAQMLRKSHVPCLFVANKAEGKTDLLDFLEFGLGEPITISATQHLGLTDLRNEIVRALEEAGFTQPQLPEKSEREIKIVFAGRPNVGKSSLINSLLDSERCIVSEVPGTTRDISEIAFEYKDKPFLLYDTAGVRRRAKQESLIEHFGILRTIEALYQADVAFLLVDSEEGPTTQDARVAEELVSAGIGIILVFNKIDLLEDWSEERTRLESIARKTFRFLPYVPVVFISAKTKKNIFTLLELAQEIWTQRNQVIDPVLLDQAFLAMTTKRPPQSYHGKPLRFSKITQITAARTPTFLIKCNHPQGIHFSYRRYITNQLREKFGFTGVPVKLDIREIRLRKSDFEK